MFKKIVNYIKKLSRRFRSAEDYLVLGNSEAEITVKYYDLLHYLREKYGWTAYLLNISNRHMYVYVGWKVIRIKFVSVRSGSYIATQVAHRGKTVSGKMVTDYIESHKEKPHANT
jgi:hypothetical protein